jgi:hypothetical protein
VRSPPESSFAGRRNDIRPGAIEAKEAIIREAEGLIRYEKFQDGHSKAQRLQREFKEAGYAGRGRNHELYRRFRAALDTFYELHKRKRAERDKRFADIAAKKERVIRSLPTACATGSTFR